MYVLPLNMCGLFAMLFPHTALREVAKVIIGRDDWKLGMRAGNNVDGVVNTPFRRMIRKMPGQLLWVMFMCKDIYAAWLWAMGYGVSSIQGHRKMKNCRGATTTSCYAT